MIQDLSGKEKSALLGAAEIALGLMGEGVEAPRVPRPEDRCLSVDQLDKNAAGKALCGACEYKAVGREWRCTVQNEPYNCPAWHDFCGGFQKKPSTPRPPQPKKKGLPVPPGVNFIYIGRPGIGDLVGQGIVTVAWKESSPGLLHLAFAFCAPCDRWCKATGRDMAIMRLDEHPLVIPCLYSPKRTVHEVARAVLSHDFMRLAALSPGVTMWERVPSWTRELGKRMEEKERMLGGRIRIMRMPPIPTHVADTFAFMAPFFIGTPRREGKSLADLMVERMMRDAGQ